MVRYSVQAFWYAECNPCVRIRTRVCTPNGSHSFLFSLLPSLFSLSFLLLSSSISLSRAFPLFFTRFFLVPSDHRNQSSSERLNTLGWLSFLGETNSIERHESTKNVQRRDIKRAFTASNAFATLDAYAYITIRFEQVIGNVV